MKLGFAFLANAAEVRDRLLFVLGGNFDTVNARELPASFVGAVAMRISFEKGHVPRGDHTFAVVVKHPDGGEVRLDGRISVGAEQVDASNFDPGVLLAVKLDGMPLPAAGIYDMHVLFDDTDLGGPRFRVVVAGTSVIRGKRRQKRSAKS